MKNTKTCTICGKELSIENFSWKYKDKGIYQSRCKTCQSKTDSEYYKKSSFRRKSIRERAKADREKARKYIKDYKITHSCCICGEDRWYLLDFHHINNNKEKEISQITTWSISRIKKEILKCAIMCANCHRDFHWHEMNDGIAFQEYKNQRKE